MEHPVSSPPDSRSVFATAPESQQRDNWKSCTSSLPAWVQAAMEEETLAQPWKQHTSGEGDDPNFAQSKDTVVFYDERIKVCYGEGSMAA